MSVFAGGTCYFLVECACSKKLFLLVSSPAEEARGDQPSVSRHVELCYLAMGVGDKRSTVCWPVQHGNWHEGLQSYFWLVRLQLSSKYLHKNTTRRPSVFFFFYCTKCLCLASQVALEGLRPTIPPGISPHICKLMKICMNEDPAKRPKFDMIVPILEKMQDKWKSSCALLYWTGYLTKMVVRCLPVLP